MIFKTYVKAFLAKDAVHLPFSLDLLPFMSMPHISFWVL